jgi:hypothetical protein
LEGGRPLALGDAGDMEEDDDDGEEDRGATRTGLRSGSAVSTGALAPADADDADAPAGAAAAEEELADSSGGGKRGGATTMVGLSAGATSAVVALEGTPRDAGRSPCNAARSTRAPPTAPTAPTTKSTAGKIQRRNFHQGDRTNRVVRPLACTVLRPLPCDVERTTTFTGGVGGVVRPAGTERG